MIFLLFSLQSATFGGLSIRLFGKVFVYFSSKCLEQGSKVITWIWARLLDTAKQRLVMTNLNLKWISMNPKYVLTEICSHPPLKNWAIGAALSVHIFHLVFVIRSPSMKQSWASKLWMPLQLRCSKENRKETEHLWPLFRSLACQGVGRSKERNRESQHRAFLPKSIK